MAQVIKFKQTKEGRAIASLANVDLGKPPAGQALIKHLAVPIEEMDAAGLSSPGIDVLGHTGVGVIEEIASKSNKFSPGDLVVYYTDKPGSLASHRHVDLNHLSPLPQNIDAKKVAANYFKGCLAHMLAVRAYIIHSNSIVLIHGASRATSLVLSQYVSLRKPKLIIGVADKEDLSKTRAGSYDRVVAYGPNWMEEVADDHGTSVVYENMGGEITGKSLLTCHFRGLVVNYGQTSKVEPRVTPAMLKRQSIYYTSPDIFQYKYSQSERFMTSIEVMEQLLEKKIGAPYQEFPLSDYQKALDSGINYPHSTPLIIFD